MKYICNTCKHHFSGDLSVSSCPVCGSPDISEDKNKASWWKWLLLALVAIFAVVLITHFCNRPIVVEASMDNSTGIITVNIKSGITKGRLNQTYQLQYVCDGSTVPNYVQVERGSKTFHIQILPNTGYTVELVAKTEKKNKKEIKYIGNKYFMWVQQIVDGDGAVVNLPPVLQIAGCLQAAQPNQTYTVTINLSSPNSFPNVQYTLDGKTQTSNKFTGIKPGSYTAKAECDGQQDSCFVNLPVFANKVSLQQAQSLFNTVRNNPMAVPDANQQLAGGSVKLKKPFPKNGIGDLYSALQDAAQNGTQFTVISFNTDPNGKIQSGTLLLK